MLLFTYESKGDKMGRIKEPPKDKQVKYSDIEKIFNQIDTYLEKIRDSEKTTEIEAELKEYEQEFEELRKEIKTVGNYQTEIKISKFSNNREVIEHLNEITFKTRIKIKTKQPKKVYKNIKKELDKLENKIKPKTAKEKLEGIFWLIIKIILILAVLDLIGTVLLGTIIAVIAGFYA